MSVKRVTDTKLFDIPELVREKLGSLRNGWLVNPLITDPYPAAGLMKDSRNNIVGTRVFDRGHKVAEITAVKDKIIVLCNPTFDSAPLVSALGSKMILSNNLRVRSGEGRWRDSHFGGFMVRDYIFPQVNGFIGTNYRREGFTIGGEFGSSEWKGITIPNVGTTRTFTWWNDLEHPFISALFDNDGGSTVNLRYYPELLKYKAQSIFTGTQSVDFPYDRDRRAYLLGNSDFMVPLRALRGQSDARNATEEAISRFDAIRATSIREATIPTQNAEVLQSYIHSTQAYGVGVLPWNRDGGTSDTSSQ